MAKNEPKKIIRIQLCTKVASSLSDSGTVSLAHPQHQLEPEDSDELGRGFRVTPLRDGKPNGVLPFFVPITNVAAVFYG